MNKFFIVRHGQTEWNLQKKFQGSLNSNLTVLGEEQARKLAESLKNKEIDHIYSSDLGRAFRTAEIISQAVGKPVNVAKSLREMSFGIWEGMNIDKIESDYNDEFEVWKKNPYELRLEGLDDMKKVQSRMVEEIESINKRHKDSNILIVSHGMTIKTVIANYMHLELDHIGRFSQDNTALNIIEFHEFGPLVKRVNDTNHLEV